MRGGSLARWRVWVGLALGLLSFVSAGFRPALSTSDLGGERLYHPQGQMLTDAEAGPLIGARAALLYDVDADRIFFARNLHARLAPASLTKLAIALVAVQRLDLAQVVTVGAEVAASDPAGVLVGLTPDDKATVEQLLYATLLTSANDAATALAAAAGGSVERGVALMNELAADLGLRDTHFINPHGLDAAGQYSSAYDLLLLTRAALRQPAIAAAVALPAATRGSWRFVNRNELVGRYAGADGVKTGTTDAAGECLIASVTRNGHRVLVVLLGCQDRYADARALLDHYFASYVWQPLALPANAFTSLPPDSQGRARYLFAADAPQVLLARWELPWLRLKLRLEPERGQPAAYFSAAGFVVAEVPLTERTP